MKGVQREDLKKKQTKNRIVSRHVNHKTFDMVVV